LFRNPFSILIASLPLVLSGCILDGSEEGTASVSLEFKGSSSELTDVIIDGQAAGMVEAAVVTIEQIYLQPADGDEERVVLRDEQVTTDLLTLSRSTAKLVEGRFVPQGRYSQLRFVISGAYLDVTGDGIYATPGYDQVPPGETVVGELKTPSFDTSGLKVQLPSDDLFDDPGVHQIVLARFDVAESFGHQAGNSGSWVMHPVIDAESIDTTSRIILDIDARPLIDADATLVDMPLVCVLWDGEAFVEMTTDLIQGTEPGRFMADFPYLFPIEGPYRLTLQTADGRLLITEPPLPDSLTISAHAEVTVEATVTAIAP
jgi:hypothetical protein